MVQEPSRRWWWLGWSWRVACASYAVGLLTFLPYALVMIWWSALLFTPLVLVTLSMTRDRAIANFGIPVMAAALYASIHLLYTGVNQLGLPQSKVFLIVWLVGLLGPFAIFLVVTRRLGAISRSVL